MVILKQKQLFEEIELLPIELKTKLIDSLLSSIQPIDKSIDGLWVTESEKRIQQIENEEVKLINGDEVFKKISEKFTS